MSKKVCVTGGTGYVAIELIKRLVEKGYQVKSNFRVCLCHRCSLPATVRDPSNSERNKPLLAFGDNVHTFEYAHGNLLLFRYLCTKRISWTRVLSTKSFPMWSAFFIPLLRFGLKLKTRREI